MLAILLTPVSVTGRGAGCDIAAAYEVLIVVRSSAEHCFSLEQ